MGLLKKHIKKSISKLGYELIRTPGKSERLDFHLYKLFDLLKINCVLDVGSNQGQYAHFLRNLGYKGFIISFEPVTIDFAILQQQTNRDPKWKAYHFALGNQDGFWCINVMSDRLFSSFLKPNELTQQMGLKVDHLEMVETRRLDSIFNECVSGITNPRVYLKMDTQGYDLKVFEGCKDILGNILALQSEISIRHLYEDTPDFQYSIATLEKKGFEITGIFPVTRDDKLRIFTVDCVMVRSSVVGETSTLYPV